MKIALVIPHTEKISYSGHQNIPQLGLGYIAGSLAGQGYNCKVIDGKTQHLKLEGILRMLKEYNPDVVGISSMTHEISRASLIARGIKQFSQQVSTVIGGCHVSAIPEQTLNEFPEFDFCVVGEGEETFPFLLKQIKNGQGVTMPGIGYRKGGRVFVNQARVLLKDINNISPPAWELFPKTDCYPVLTSRGCPYKCIFCMRASGDIVRYRKPDLVIEEIERLINFHKARFIDFRDEDFNVNIPHKEEILELMLKKGIAGKIKWFAMGHIGAGTAAFYKKMKKAGCLRIAFGVESGNEAILKKINKNITVGQIKDTINMAKAAGLKTAGYYILGFPNETKDTLNDTIKLAADLNTEKACFGIMVAYPGTEIYEMAKNNRNGYRLISRKWSDYDKYLGGSLELENIPRRLLEFYQFKAYIYFYLTNFRLMAFSKFILTNIKPGLFFIFNLFKKYLRRRN